MTERFEKIEHLRYLLRSINRRLEHYFTLHLQQYDLTFPQLLLIREVYRHSNLPISELSQRLGLANSTVCGMVDRLEKRELLARVRDTHDRRVIRIATTPKMLAKAKEFQLAHSIYLMRFTESFSDTEIEQMVNALTPLQRELAKETTQT